MSAVAALAIAPAISPAAASAAPAVPTSAKDYSIIARDIIPSGEPGAPSDPFDPGAG